jgi:hypothetical protein
MRRLVPQPMALAPVAARGRERRGRAEIRNGIMKKQLKNQEIVAINKRICYAKDI